ncbi:hypothetical protein [Bradyrhizobium genosp. A]|uniref:hypothetical protein n=1 Tax=Bradyrhizobium genosp. A TaxID=83626 RepID=UPI003CF16709
MQFTVGLKLNGKADHVVLDAQDALAAALKVKTEFPEAVIIYVRPQNRRGDTRHPSHPLAEDVVR